MDKVLGLTSLYILKGRIVLLQLLPEIRKPWEGRAPGSTLFCILDIHYIPDPP